MTRRQGTALLFVLGILPLEFNGFYNPALLPRPGLYWAVEVFTWIVLPAVLCWQGSRRGWFDAAALGLRETIAGRGPSWLVGGAVVLLSVVVWQADVWSNAFAHHLFPDALGAADFDYSQVLPTRGAARALAVAYFALSAGIVEEVYFRGMLRSLFPAGGRGGLAFVAVSSLLFASIHWEGGTGNMLHCLLFGLAGGTVYALTGNLWPLIIGHTMTDLLWFV